MEKNIVFYPSNQINFNLGGGKINPQEFGLVDFGHWYSKLIYLIHLTIIYYYS